MFLSTMQSLPNQIPLNAHVD